MFLGLTEYTSTSTSFNSDNWDVFLFYYSRRKFLFPLDNIPSTLFLRLKMTYIHPGKYIPSTGSYDRSGQNLSPIEDCEFLRSNRSFRSFPTESPDRPEVSEKVESTTMSFHHHWQLKIYLFTIVNSLT